MALAGGGGRAALKILVTGASGLVGSRLLRVFADHEVTGTRNSRAAEGLLSLDLADPAAIDALVDDLQPDLVLHPAAMPAVDRCELEPELSLAINVEGTRAVARAAARVGARVVYFSSDYVFDGSAGPYEIDAEPAPINEYGRHKLAAEQAVSELVDDHVIVRICGVYGHDPRGVNFIMQMLARASSGETMKAPRDQWGTPTCADNLAAAVRELALSDYRGVAHPVGPDCLPRDEFARRAAAALGLDAGFIQAVDTPELAQPAPRPLRCGLDNRRTQELLSLRLLGIDEGLAAVAAELGR